MKPTASINVTELTGAIFNRGDSLAHCLSHSPLDALETRMLLCHVCDMSRVQLITQSHFTLSEQQAAAFSSLVQRRLNGEPIAYILGSREFFGLTFVVTPDVLIPRPDTELLVELALQYAPANGTLLDMGTGSGAIAISVAKHRPDVDVLATDLSPAALAVAQANATALLQDRKPIQLMISDWYAAIAPQAFDMIVSNPPYIVKDDRHLSEGDLRFEPINALTDHQDGLSAYRQIIAGAVCDTAAHLRKDGWLMLEHGYDQSAAVQALLLQHGFIEVQSWPDLAGILRVSGGRRI
jgi:release factor glutamine methyltransferase